MKKLILLLLCGAFVPLLYACEKEKSTESSSFIEEHSSAEISESVDGGIDSNSSSTVEDEDGGDNALVNGYYKFNAYEQYAQFYTEFMKLNEERYCVPIVSIDESFDTTEYIFKVSPVSFEIANNHLYVGVEFPESQTLSFYFSKSDMSVIGVHKSVTIRGEVFDVSNKSLVGNSVVLVQTDEEGREYNVCLGETILCSFEIGMTGYDNKAEYLQLIESGFILN